MSDSTTDSLVLDIDPGQQPLASSDSTVQVDGWTIDRSAYVGLPASLADHATSYVSSVLEAVDVQSVPTRAVYEVTEDDDSHMGRSPFNPIAIRKVGEEPVPIVLLPSPDLVRAVQAWSEKHQWGSFRESTDVIDWDSSINGASGRSLYFEPGITSDTTFRFPPPVPDGVRVAGFQMKQSDLTNRMRKVVFNPWAESFRVQGNDVLEPLALDSFLGADTVGRVITVDVVPGNPRLRKVQLEIPGQSVQTWTAYALIDGIGELQKMSLLDGNGTSNFEKPLSSPSHDPKLDGHSLLRLPSPMMPWKQNDPIETLQKQVSALEDTIKKALHANNKLSEQNQELPKQLLSI